MLVNVINTVKLSLRSYHYSEAQSDVMDPDV